MAEGYGMVNNTPTIFVVDDDERVRRATARLLNAEGLNVEAFPSAEGFLEAYTPERMGCLVLDVRMPGLSGLDLQRHLLDKGIQIPIVFITGHGNVPMSVRAMKDGAVDFIEKPYEDRTLLDAIKAALMKDAKQRRCRAEEAEVGRRVSRLTPREREVFELVVLGKPNKQIAAELGTSEQTIKVHRGRVMSKMEAGSLAELVVLAQKAGVDTTKAFTTQLAS
jgi:two-component system response regulator FixJ